MSKETQKTGLEKIKEAFAKKVASLKAQITPASFAEVTTTDETVLSYEGELAVGTQMMIMVDEESVPAPEGTYDLVGEMEGTTITLDAEGVVVEIVAPDENSSDDDDDGDGEPSGISEEEMNAKLAEQKAELEKKFEAEKQKMLKDHQKDVEELQNAFEAYQKENGQEPPKKKFSSEGSEKLSVKQQRLLHQVSKRNR